MFLFSFSWCVFSYYFDIASSSAANLAMLSRLIKKRKKEATARTYTENSTGGPDQKTLSFEAGGESRKGGGGELLNQCADQALINLTPPA